MTSEKYRNGYFLTSSLQLLERIVRVLILLYIYSMTIKQILALT